jgi:hypothetical protein
MSHTCDECSSNPMDGPSRKAYLAVDTYPRTNAAIFIPGESAIHCWREPRFLSTDDADSLLQPYKLFKALAGVSTNNAICIRYFTSITELHFKTG